VHAQSLNRQLQGSFRHPRGDLNFRPRGAIPKILSALSVPYTSDRDIYRSPRDFSQLLQRQGIGAADEAKVSLVAERSFGTAGCFERGPRPAAGGCRLTADVGEQRSCCRVAKDLNWERADRKLIERLLRRGIEITSLQRQDQFDISEVRVIADLRKRAASGKCVLIAG